MEMPMIALLSLLVPRWPSIGPGSSWVRNVTHICVVLTPWLSVSRLGTGDCQSV